MGVRLHNRWSQTDKGPPIHELNTAPPKTLDHLVSRDSQVAEVALSLSDFNPAAKMAPNPDLLSEMRQGAWGEVMVWIQSCVFVFFV